METPRSRGDGVGLINPGRRVCATTTASAGQPGRGQRGPHMALAAGPGDTSLWEANGHFRVGGGAWRCPQRCLPTSRGPPACLQRHQCVGRLDVGGGRGRAPEGTQRPGSVLCTQPWGTSHARPARWERHSEGRPAGLRGRLGPGGAPDRQLAAPPVPRWVGRPSTELVRAACTVPGGRGTRRRAGRHSPASSTPAAQRRGSC